MEKEGRQNANNGNFQLWRQDNHPIELYTPAVIWQRLEYIHNNPVEAGFTDVPESYLYSSARNYYCGSKGLIEIKLLDPLICFY